MKLTATGDTDQVVRVAPRKTRRLMQAATEVSRRAHHRATIRLPIRVSIPSVDFAIESEALNVSRGGMFIAVSEDMPPIGKELDVEVTLAGGDLLLHATAKVVRHERRRRPHGIGVQFVQVSYGAQALIDRMVKDQRAFGSYRLEKMVGRGGMAEVYRARALEGPHAGRTVAIKRMIPELAREALMVDLFAKEAAVTRLLKHPNIVEVLDVGTVGDTAYIAMDYVDGTNLFVILEECRRRDIFMPVDFACYVVKTVADALHYAHCAADDRGEPLGIVHRDVAPSNIFVSRDGDVLLGDFGVAYAKALSSAREGRTLAGKDPYLPPEAILRREVSPASDVFALGAILFELLTNQRAFTGDRRAMWRKIVGGEVPHPRVLRPEISPALAELILRALSPRVGENGAVALRVRARELLGNRHPGRFTTAAELAAALEPLYDDAIGTKLAIASVVRNLTRR